MRGKRCTIVDRIRYVFRAQRGKALLYLPGLGGISLESHVGEFGVRGSGMDSGYLDAMTQKIDPHAMRDGIDGGLGRAVYIPLLVYLFRGYAAQIDNMSMAGSDQQGKHRLAHV